MLQSDERESCCKEKALAEIDDELTAEERNDDVDEFANEVDDVLPRVFLQKG